MTSCERAEMKNVSIRSVALFFLFILSGCKTYEYQCYDCGIRLNNLYLESSTTKKGKYTFNYFYLSGRYLDFKDFLVFKSDTLFDSFPFNFVKGKKTSNSVFRSIIIQNSLFNNDSITTESLLKRYLIADKDTFAINWRDTVFFDQEISSFYLYFDFTKEKGPRFKNGRYWYLTPEKLTFEVETEKTFIKKDNKSKVYYISFKMPYSMWYKKDIIGDTLFKRGDTLWYKKENLYYVPVKKR